MEKEAEDRRGIEEIMWRQGGARGKKEKGTRKNLQYNLTDPNLMGPTQTEISGHCQSNLNKFYLMHITIMNLIKI